MVSKDKYYRVVEAMLCRYKNVEAEIQNIDLAIEELECEYQGCLPIGYKEKSGPTHKFSSVVENEFVNKKVKPEYLKALKKKALIQNRKIDNALNTLDYRSREVIELKYFMKLSNKQVAARLDLTEQWVCEIKRKAINSLITSIFVR